MDGITFTITGEGVNQSVTTDRNGEIHIDNLMPGIYTVTEQSYDKYVPQESHRVTVLAGQTATVSFNNVLRRGNLTVTKTSEDGLNQGVKFHLFGTSLSGLSVDDYAVTDENGVATFKDVLIGTGYTLEEMDTAIRYVVPDSQSTAVEWNSVTNKSFSNILKKFNVTVTKSDCEVGTAQGDASLAGAAYGIYKGDQLVDTYYTDENGQFTTGYYVCGDDWTIREISPSEGYLLDGTVYPVGAEAANYTVELNAAPAVAVAEQVQKGNIAIIKHSDNGDTQIETPEEGAVFAVYLKSAGSYEAAKDTERDYLTCDENGFVQSKDLPYGVYTVHQVSGWEGRELMSDFDVFIAKNGETYRYLINNANFESFIKVIKVDAETGNTIPYAGAGFQIFRPDGSKVEMTFTYPDVTTIDTFYTNDAGMLITPEKLEFGKGYSLKEVSAPYGYVLSHEAVKFDVTEENSTEESGVTVVAVKLGNYAQKGIIKISKTGEVFASVAAADGVYQPVYTVQGLAGATYEIKATEDIYTPDGTLRCSAGEVVDTVTTGADGTAESKPLYLGKYEITEMKAPDGMVVNKDAHTAELVYAGQEIEITETAASFCNDRQKARISLSKVLEQNKQFGIGMNNELSAVTFGFYAAEELTAADGSVIPVDGLIEIMSLDENGKAVLKSDVPFGSYYVREISTDSHYYGVRVDTEKYAYLLRLNPDRGEYNLYCYCYRRDWLDQHLKDAEKGIRFIDSHYKELFRIPDGGKVKIHYSWNEDQIRTCRYIDDYHVEIGSNLYHICEFAERMEYGGHTCEPVRDNLPERCYSVLSGSDEIIIIKRGEKGYFKTDIPVTDKDEARSIANEYNAKLGVSRAQEEAMKAGSMFGFQVPAADPRNYDADGKPVMPKDRGDAR